MFHPLAGFWQKEHFDALTEPFTTNIYGGDYSGENEYRFNSLGFRGAEPHGSGVFTIYVFGCSHTTGVGVNENEIWHSRFKQRLAREIGVDEERVEVINFSFCGSSSDFISRLVVTQCSVKKPDLVLLEFAEKNRTENYLSGYPLPIGVWMKRAWFVRMVAAVRKSRMLPQFTWDIFTHFHKVGQFYSYYTEDAGVMNALRNILMVQYFCQANDIQYLLSFKENELLDEPEYKDNPVFAQMMDLIDQRYFCRRSLADEDISVDLSVDNCHVGPQSHQNFGDAMWAFFMQSPLRNMLAEMPVGAVTVAAAKNHVSSRETAKEYM